MQSLWSTHSRRSNIKINLNAPSQIAATAAEPTPETTTGHTDAALKIHGEDDAPHPATSTSAPPSSGKRKIRSRTAGGDESNKRAKLSSPQEKKDYAPPPARLSDLGGVGGAVEKMLELVAMPLCHPEIYLHTGVQPPRGVLLHGPPGCGKTLLANAIAGVRALRHAFRTLLKRTQELGVSFISISAPSIVSGMSGESEKTLRDTFDEAKVCSTTVS